MEHAIHEESVRIKVNQNAPQSVSVKISPSLGGRKPDVGSCERCAERPPADSEDEAAGPKATWCYEACRCWFYTGSFLPRAGKHTHTLGALVNKMRSVETKCKMHIPSRSLQRTAESSDTWMDLQENFLQFILIASFKCFLLVSNIADGEEY